MYYSLQAWSNKFQQVSGSSDYHARDHGNIMRHTYWLVLAFAVVFPFMCRMHKNRLTLLKYTFLAPIMWVDDCKD